MLTSKLMRHSDNQAAFLVRHVRNNYCTDLFHDDLNLPRCPAPKYQYILDDRVFRDVLNLKPGGRHAFSHIICNGQEGNYLATFPAAVSVSRLLSKEYYKLYSSRRIHLVRYHTIVDRRDPSRVRQDWQRLCCSICWMVISA